jgi:hypothetical protein
VLRNLVEARSSLGTAASRFELGHAVLGACPNEGTPLATPARWQETVGWFANLIDMFPDNPFITAVQWVAEAVVWIAETGVEIMPGIASMQSGGELVSQLQAPPGPSPAAYSAIAANFRADAALWQRLLDMGIDGFFGGANDLVVPTEGGWRIDEAIAAIPESRVACFGPGGNLRPALGDVHHLNIMNASETQRFLVEALEGQPHNLPPVALRSRLPDRRARVALEALQPLAAARASMGPEPAPGRPSAIANISPVYNDTFQIVVLDGGTAGNRLGRGNRGNDLRLMASYAGARVVAPFASRGGEAGRRWYEIIKRHETIRNYVMGRAAEPNEEFLIEYGKLLFEMLFQADVRSLYDVARSLERKGRLNVLFTSMIPWIGDKPWEFAYDPTRSTFLATEDIHFVRNALGAIPAERILPRAGPLRILAAIAQPIGSGKLSSEQEEEAIRRGFAPLTEEGMVEIEVLRATTPAKLHGWLSTGNYDIVHFIGHGEWDEKKKKGVLLFEGENGKQFRVEERTVREVLCQRGVRLIFLNACESGRESGNDFNKGIAQSLVAHGVPAVVANQFPVLDSSATAFSQHFYWALAQGQTIAEAARESRIAVNYSLAGETIDWAVPVVYARDPAGSLCESRRLSPASFTAPQATSTQRRSTLAHPVKVAVWDVNYVFPKIDETITALNAAQDRFGFEVVHTSAPIGTWQYAGKQRLGKEVHIYANHVARKLKAKTVQLGVSYLFCITDRLIDYTDTNGDYNTGIYGWWPDKDDEDTDLADDLIIFSAAIEDLPVSGREGARVLTNALVMGLAARRANVGCHLLRGARSRSAKEAQRHCPLYEDPDIDVKLIASPQRFDPQCRRELAGALPRGDVAALDTLLRVFD